jgi:hypothetical protein
MLLKTLLLSNVEPELPLFEFSEVDAEIYGNKFVIKKTVKNSKKVGSFS